MLTNIFRESQVGSQKGILSLLFTKACTADLGGVLPQMISRSICWFDEESDAIKAQASDDSLRTVVAECLLSAAALSGTVLPTWDQKPGSTGRHTAGRGFGMFLGFTFRPWLPVLLSWCLKPSQGHVLRAVEPDTLPPLVSWGLSKEGQLWK